MQRWRIERAYIHLRNVIFRVESFTRVRIVHANACIYALYSWARKKKDVVYSDQRGETTVVIIPLVHCGTVIVDKDSSMGNLLRYLADAELRKQWMSFRESFISPFIILIKLLHLSGSTYPYHSYAIYIYASHAWILTFIIPFQQCWVVLARKCKGPPIS